MSHYIAEPCIGTKDAACVDVCPVDCIHPRRDEAEFDETTMLFIHPDECIDCGACVPACPVMAIYDSVDATPSHQKDLIEANSVFRSGARDAVAKAEALVQAHIVAHPALMAVPPTERQAAHDVHFVRTSSE
jgi:ferredoxin